MPKIGQTTLFRNPAGISTEVEARKSTYAMSICVTFLPFSDCAPRVNDPADVQAVKSLLANFDIAFIEDKPDAAANDYYLYDAVRLEAHRAALVGNGAIRACKEVPL